MHIDIIDRMEDLVRHQDEWEGIYRDDPEAHYFLSWTWMVNWLNHLDEQWFVLAAKPDAGDGRYGAFFPIQLRTEVADEGGFTNSIRMGTWSLAGYSGFICRPQFEDDAIPAFGETIKSFNWAQLRLETMLASKKRFDLLTASFPRDGFSIDIHDRRFNGDDSDYSIYPYVELPDDFETYLQTKLGKATRSNARSLLRKLDGVDLRITHATAESFERDLDILMGFWETKWGPLKGEWGLKRESADHRVMLRACFAAGEALLPVLWQGDKPIGAQGTFIDNKNRALRCLVGSRDLSVKKPSPGFIIHLESIRWAIENGFTTYDLMTGNHTYKYDFGPQERHLVRYVVRPVEGGNLGGKLDPRCLPVAFERVRILAQAGRVDDALTTCRQVLEVDPEHAEARRFVAELEARVAGALRGDIQRALGAINSGRPGDASQILAGTVKASPRSFDAHHLLGVSLLMQGQFEPAERRIAHAIAISPEQPAAHVNRGRALLALARYKDALASFKRAVELSPDNAGAHAGCGEALAHLGRFVPALVAFDRALALNPQDARVRQGREEARKRVDKRK